MRRPHRSGIAIGVLLLWVAWAMPSGAAATTLQLDLEEAPGLEPGEQVVVKGVLTYTYEHATRNATHVTLTPTRTPAWLLASITPATLDVDASHPSGRTEVPVHLTLGVLDGTDALTQGAVDLRARAQANEPLDAAVAVDSVVVRVAFDGRVRVELLDPEPMSEPGEPVEVRARLLNEANGPARVEVQVLGAPDDMRVVAPGAFIVENEGPLRERNVTVGLLPSTPGSYPLTLRWSFAHAFDPSQRADPVDTGLTVEVEEAKTPAPGALGVVAAAAIAFGVAERLGRRRGSLR